MVRLVLTLALLAMPVLPGISAAQDSASAGPRLILGPNATSLGLGPESELRLNEHFGLRVGTNHAPLETQHEGLEPEFSFNVTPPATSAMLDYYPFRDGFRLTGGLRYNPEAPDLTEGPASGITIGGLPFTPSTSRYPIGRDDYVGYAPYGGLGLQSSFWEGRLELVFDLGVYYQGDPSDEAAGGAGTGSGSEAKAEDAEEDMGFFGFYPIIGLSATYRF